MSLWSSFAKSITGLCCGICSQSRPYNDRMVVVESRAPVKAPASQNQHLDPLPHSPEPPSTATLPPQTTQNQDLTSDTKIFSPELMAAKAAELETSQNAKNSSDFKPPSKPSEIDKLELCKRIIQSKIPEEKKTKFNEFFKNFTANPLGVRGNIKFTNEYGVEKINEITMAMNGLNENFDDNFKNKINEILENLNNKEAFDYYMIMHPKSNTTSPEGSTDRSSSRASSPGSIPRAPYTPAGSTSPATSSGSRLVFTFSPARGLSAGG